MAGIVRNILFVGTAVVGTACSKLPPLSEICDGDASLADTTITGAEHVEGEVEYADTPPMGGDHNACWTTWTAHTTEVPEENWVHNLEHGGVVFLYNCPDGCEEEVTALTAFVADLPTGRGLLTPYAAMASEFAAVAWEHRLLTRCLDLDAFQTFFDEHVAQATEDVTADPAAGCTP